MICFRKLPAFAGVPFFFAHRSPCMKAGTGATVKLLVVVSGSARCFNTSQNLTRTDLNWRSAMATLDCRYFSTASQLLPAVSPTVPSVLPDSALDEGNGVDADYLLQNPLDELQTLQARFARLGQMLLPYLGAANPCLLYTSRCV